MGWLKAIHHISSLRRRRNPTVLKAAPLSLFWALNGLNELPEVRLEFTFNLIGKLTIAFLMDQSWRVHKSWYTGGGPEQGFRRCFSDGLKGCISAVKFILFLIPVNARELRVLIRNETCETTREW